VRTPRELADFFDRQRVDRLASRIASSKWAPTCASWVSPTIRCAIGVRRASVPI